MNDGYNASSTLRSRHSKELSASKYLQLQPLLTFVDSLLATYRIYFETDDSSVNKITISYRVIQEVNLHLGYTGSGTQ